MSRYRSTSVRVGLDDATAVAPRLRRAIEATQEAIRVALAGLPRVRGKGLKAMTDQAEPHFSKVLIRPETATAKCPECGESVDVPLTEGDDGAFRVDAPERFILCDCSSLFEADGMLVVAEECT